jgi:hypothetical protein
MGEASFIIGPFPFRMFCFNISKPEIGSQLFRILICLKNDLEVMGLSPEEKIKRLHAKNIIASTSPCRVNYARLTFPLTITDEEVKIYNNNGP